MLIKLKDALLGAGLDTSSNTFDFHIKSIFNVINTILLVCLHLVIGNEIIRSNPKGVIIAGGFTLMLLFIHWLNFKGKFEIAAKIFCGLLPFGISLLCITYTGVQFVDFYFATFVLALMLFIRSNVTRIAYAILYFALYIGIKYHQAHYPYLLEFELDKATNIALILVFVIIFWALSNLLMKRLRDSDGAKDDLVQNLKVETQALEKANIELERLIALASHDLKSPLRTISNYAGLIKKKNNDEKLEPYLDVIGDSSRHMINLIDQTITYGTIENNVELKTEVDINAVVEKVCIQLGDKYGDYELVLHNLTTIRSQGMAIHQVLQNIIENGLKYNESESRKIIVAQSEDDTNHYLKITDNGIGIAQGDYDKIFAMYERLHGNATYEGSGIGLAICKKAINKMGGDIVLNSKVGEGSNFTIIFPKEEPVRQSKADESPEISAHLRTVGYTGNSD